MPSLTNIIKQASRGADLYFVFRFLRLLTMKWTRTDAYKYKIIDKKGNALRKSSELESTNEKAASNIDLDFSSNIGLFFSFNFLMELSELRPIISLPPNSAVFANTST